MLSLTLLGCKSAPADSRPPVDTDPPVEACISAAEIAYDGIDQDCDGIDLIDVDGDGFPYAADCDDQDPGAFPGAEEHPYDGVDQDCDGSDLDDLDADGFDRAADCDDADPDVNPSALELCDGADQDCDGFVDEEAADALSGYLDADGDGYGDPALTWSGCTAQGPAEGGDCDDADPAIFPGAGELCDDLLDNDCDGYTDQMVAGWTHATVQEAIDAACLDGDTVWVAPGTWLETIVVDRPITLEAIEDASTTIIDASTCSGDCPVITIEADDVTIRGLTVTGGSRPATATHDGGGITASGVDNIVIEGCRVTANSAYWGNGVALKNGSGRIVDCEIDHNRSAGAYGGGIYLRREGPYFLEGNTIHDNSGQYGGGVILYFNDERVVLAGNRITGNVAETAGGGIYFADPRDLLSFGNVVSGNSVTSPNSSCGGGGVEGTSASSWESYHDTISANTPDDMCVY